MTGAVTIDATQLPADPLAAAAAFHSEIVPMVRDVQAGDVLVSFALAEHTHDAWRRAAVQALARDLSPRRVNGLVGDDAAGLAQLADYLAKAPGVTGQVFEVAANGAKTG